MAVRSDSDVPIGELAGIRLGVSDKFFQCRGWDRRMRGYRERINGQAYYRVQILVWVVERPGLLGAARATWAAPKEPAAPPTLSMNTVPKRGLILSAQGRARASKPPPGGNGTTSRIGRVGYACACAVRDAAEDAAAPASRCRNRRRGIFIVFPRAGQPWDKT